MKNILVATLVSIAAWLAPEARAQVPVVEWKVSSYARGTELPRTGSYTIDGAVAAVAARLDANGNLYVAGSGRNVTDYDLLLVKFGPDGVERWRSLVDGVAHSDDAVSDLAVDARGNSYIVGVAFKETGCSYLVVKLDAQGFERWRHALPCPSDEDYASARLALDDAGNVYIAVSSPYGSSNDYLVAKFNADGVEQWRTPAGTRDYPYFFLSAMAVDPEGNVHIAGTAGKAARAGTSRFGSDYLTVKIGRDGKERWRVFAHGVADVNDIASTVALDAAGNVYVTGYSSNGLTYDFLTIKHGADGAEKWRAVAANATGPLNSAILLATDAQGNVYVSGASARRPSDGWGSTFLTIKYRADGTEQWRAGGNPPAGEYSVPKAIALDAAGNAYVTGSSYQGVSADFLTVKYASQGGEAWRVGLSGAAGKFDLPFAIAVDVDRSVLVVGTAYEDPAVSALTVVKYSQALSAEAAVSLEVSREATYVYADNLVLTAMVRMLGPKGTVTMFAKGAPIPPCMSIPVVAIAPDVGLAECIIDYVQELAPPSTPTYEAVFTYPPGHPSGRTSERATRTFTIFPETSERGGLYWGGPGENGWGASVVQHGINQFIVAYVYDERGAPVWYVMPDARPDGRDGYSSAVYRTSSSPFAQYDAAMLRVGTPVGRGRIDYRDREATLALEIDGTLQTKAVKRFDFAREDLRAKLRVGDLWWGGEAESGWGLALVQQNASLFIAWYTYGADGKSTFFTIPSGTWSGTTYTGDVFSSTSSPWLGRAYDPAALRVKKEGSMTIDFIDQDNALMTYSVGAVTQTKRIRRFAF